MLMGRPYYGDQMCLERELHFLHIQQIKEQSMINGLSLLQREQLNEYYQPQPLNGNRWEMCAHLAQGNQHTAVTLPEPVTNYNNMSLVPTFGSNAMEIQNTNVKLKFSQPINRNCRGVEQNTWTFGSLRTEHRREHYQSKGLQSRYDYNSNLVPQYSRNVQCFCLMPVYFQACPPIYLDQGHYFYEQGSCSQRHQDRKQEYIKSQTTEPTFRIATISPRSECMQNRKVKTSKIGVYKSKEKKLEEKKLLRSKIEYELSCSPILQFIRDLNGWLK